MVYKMEERGCSFKQPRRIYVGVWVYHAINSYSDGY